MAIFEKTGPPADLEHEARLLGKCQHPCIVKLLGVEVKDGGAKLLMEGCQGGDLVAHLPFSTEATWDILIQLLLALLHIHEQGIVHGDVKPSNILLEEWIHGVPRIRLGDFGSAHQLGEERIMEGTPYYLSPELWRESKQTPASDVWALGCTVYETACGFKAFPATNMASLRQQILRGEWNASFVTDSDLQNCISWMLTADAQERPTVKDLLIKLRGRCQSLQQRLSNQPLSFDQVWQQLSDQWGDARAYQMIMTLLKVKADETPGDWYVKAKVAWNNINGSVEDLNHTLRLTSFMTQIRQPPLKLGLSQLLELQRLVDQHLDTQQQAAIKTCLLSQMSDREKERQIMDLVGAPQHQQLQLQQVYSALWNICHFERNYFQ